MTRITNTDQVLLLLRAHLERAERTKRSTRSGKVTPRKRTTTERVADIASDSQASQEDIHRALITGILVEEFGAGIAADARFQGLIIEITRMVSSHPECADAVDRAIEQIIAG